MHARLSRRLAGFRPLGIAFIIFFLINIAVFAVLSIWPGLVEWLWLSADRPWGILTSAFTQVEIGHLASNLQGFIFVVVLFALVNMINPKRVRRRRSRAFLLIVFVAGIGANLIEYPLALANPGDSSWGSSGIVYGGFGVLLASAIQTMPAHLKAISKERRRRAKKPRLWKVFRYDRKSLRTMPSILTLALVASFLALIIFDPETFLNVAPGVDVFAHAFGFLLGLIGFVISKRIG